MSDFDEPQKTVVFQKHDSDKLRLELIPPTAIEAMGRAFTYGAKKYGANNWTLCDDPSRYVGAALRHIVAWERGELFDAESGLSHLDHALASLAMLQGLVEKRLGRTVTVDRTPPSGKDFKP